jgi:hypothetical protein
MDKTTLWRNNDGGCKKGCGSSRKGNYPFEARPQRVASLFPEAVRETALRFLTGIKMDSKIKSTEG